jgi:hypothetical protein
MQTSKTTFHSLLQSFQLKQVKKTKLYSALHIVSLFSLVLTLGAIKTIVRERGRTRGSVDEKAGAG